MNKNSNNKMKERKTTNVIKNNILFASNIKHLLTITKIDKEKKYIQTKKNEKKINIERERFIQ